MDTEVFIVTNDWQSVTLGGEDVTGVTVSIVNKGNNTIEVVRSETIPTEDEGGAALSKEGQGDKYSLISPEKLWVRTPNTRAKIAVISGQ